VVRANFRRTIGNNVNSFRGTLRAVFHGDTPVGARAVNLLGIAYNILQGANSAECPFVGQYDIVREHLLAASDRRIAAYFRDGITQLPPIMRAPNESENEESD